MNLKIISSFATRNLQKFSWYSDSNIWNLAQIKYINQISAYLCMIEFKRRIWWLITKKKGPKSYELYRDLTRPPPEGWTGSRTREKTPLWPWIRENKPTETFFLHITAPCKDSSIPQWKPSLREISFDGNTSLKAEFLNSFNFSLKNIQGEGV